MDNCPHCGGQLGKKHDFVGPEIPDGYLPFWIGDVLTGYVRSRPHWNPPMFSWGPGHFYTPTEKLKTDGFFQDINSQLFYGE